jgi:hypothetical protein
MNSGRELEYGISLRLSADCLSIVGFRAVLSPELEELIAERRAVQVRFRATLVDIGV